MPKTATNLTRLSGNLKHRVRFKLDQQRNISRYYVTLEVSLFMTRKQECKD